MAKIPPLCDVPTMLPKTPREAIDRNLVDAEKYEWIRQASIKELEDFCHLALNRSDPHTASDLAKIALGVRIAEEQIKLAKKLESQTNRLIVLTWGLVILSIALLAMAAVQTKIMPKENAEAHVQQVQTSQTNE